MSVVPRKNPQGRKSTMADTRKSSKRTDEAVEGFTDEERAAMKERAKEVKAARKGSRSSKADKEGEVPAKIAEMPDHDRVMAEKLHAIIKANAPELSSRLWYGMPAYAKDGKVLCFFQGSEKFKTRYSMFGFNDNASLDDGNMWPTAYALEELTAEDEKRFGELIKKAVR
ncbi:iron chaperone [Spirillospora sp. NPDC048911]|uniref:iron chaperone n=1 Tax=Spirillospora sp. NPDC048911 TaxID=3364527 RepID=UPI0037158EFE